MLTNQGLGHEELTTTSYSLDRVPCCMVSHRRGKKVPWRHSMIEVRPKHEMQFQLINSIVNRQHFNTLEFICTNKRYVNKVEKISHNFDV